MAIAPGPRVLSVRQPWAELKDVVTRLGAARFGRWFEGPYGFVLSNVRPLKRPVPTLGKLGLFRPSRMTRRTPGLSWQRYSRGA